MKHPHALAWYYFAFQNRCVNNPAIADLGDDMQNTWELRTGRILRSFQALGGAAEPWLVGYIVTHLRRNPRKGRGFNSQALITYSH